MIRGQLLACRQGTVRNATRLYILNSAMSIPVVQTQHVTDAAHLETQEVITIRIIVMKAAIIAIR